MRWHQLDVAEAVKTLESSLRGLSPDEAQKRLREYGPNELIEKKRKTVLMMFLDQFKDFMILVLIAAAAVSGIIGELTDTIAIVVIVVLNAVIGFVQEYRAERAMAALKQMAESSATLLRDGAHVEVPVSEVVPGEIVLLEAGRIVPADMRLVEAARLMVQEAALTGESMPVEKITAPLGDEKLPLGDRKNMLYRGTTVSYGRGAGLVVATGMETELGKIAAMLQEEEGVKTPLQKRLDRFGQRLAVAVLAICAVVFSLGLLRGEPPLLMLLTAISLAVAAIPEALPAVVTISLALGARKMVRQNALIRKLPAVETLGSITYICSDKTGTLTMNRMSVEEVYVDRETLAFKDFPEDRENGTPSLLLKAMALSTDVKRTAGGEVMGDPTEVAFYLAAQEKGLEKETLEREFPRVAEVPFDSDRKCMSTFHKWGEDGYISFTKGAADVLMGKSTGLLMPGGEGPLDETEFRRANDRMAGDGLRVLSVAMRLWKELPDDISPEVVETGLTLVGLVGIMDPPRPEAREAVSICKAAGIKTVMITGDHPITARAVARRIGIMDEDGEVTTGRELERMSLEEFEKRVEHIRVYARVAPEQKLKIVRALQDRGQFTAMTGDGVNDAPALKRADIGVAMGLTGTDVAKESAHMILLDDNFATIVKAVKEGRKIFDNIRKFIKYTMASNSGEIWTILLAPFFGLPIPLLPIHILWINLVTDGLPGLALAVEPAEGDIMRRPPRPPHETVFAHGLGFFIIWVGLLMGFACIFTQAWAINAGHARWQTMVFTVLCLSQLGNVLAIRSDTESVFSQGLTSNKPLLGTLIFTFGLQMATIYVPFLNPIFKTEPLSLAELSLTIAISSVVFLAVEAEKLFRRRRSRAV